MDGLTALQEYKLNLETSGQFGKPAGKWSALLLPKPTGFTTSNPSVTLIECASNGIILARVSGTLVGSSVATTYPYTYRQSTGEWARAAAPDGFPDTTSITPLDVNSSGQVVGYFYAPGTKKGFVWTPDTNGGQTEVFELDTVNGLVPAIPQRIGDYGNTTGRIGSNPLSGARFAARPDHTEVEFSGSGTEIAYHDVNGYGEFVGTVFNPFLQRYETFLAYESFPDPEIFTTGMAASDLKHLYLWSDVPDIDPDEINWGASEPGSGYQIGTTLDRTTDELIWIATDIIGSTPLFWCPDWDYYPGETNYWNEFPGFSYLIGSANDWGEFAGLFDASTSYLYVDQDWTELDSGQNSDTGTFFFDGSFHITQARPSVYGVSNDPRVLVGSPFAVWAGSLIVPVANIMPPGFPTSINAARISDNGRLALQCGSQLYTLQPDQDADGDSMPDDWEMFYGLDPANPADASGDADGDGISNRAEFRYRTNPALVTLATGQAIDIRPGIDTDGDGIPNVWEWKHGLDYEDASDAMVDSDGDGLTNSQEFQIGANPYLADSIFFSGGLNPDDDISEERYKSIMTGTGSATEVFDVQGRANAIRLGRHDPAHGQTPESFSGYYYPSWYGVPENGVDINSTTQLEAGFLNSQFVGNESWENDFGNIAYGQYSVSQEALPRVGAQLQQLRKRLVAKERKPYARTWTMLKVGTRVSHPQIPNQVPEVVSLTSVEFTIQENHVTSQWEELLPPVENG